MFQSEILKFQVKLKYVYHIKIKDSDKKKKKNLISEIFLSHKILFFSLKI